jgi:nucleotide-binding universal stress UspA family protein
MIKTILVAVDGSDHAKKAVALAAELAEKYDAKLVLAHALLRDARFETLRKLVNRRTLPKAQRDELDNYEAEVLVAMAGADGGLPHVFAPADLLEEVGKQVLEKASEAAKRQGAKKISTATFGGDPADAILEAAQRQKADLIVLGTRGFGDFKGLILGSVSHKVSSRAHCPVLTVK